MISWATSGMELPPRARRIQKIFSDPPADRGTTSACAENTTITNAITQSIRNYLRVRGEYHDAHRVPLNQLELPPRARRIHSSRMRRISLAGTTSACAENTLAAQTRSPCGGNYLRVRGEYWSGMRWVADCEELPPRARRILGRKCHWGRSSGTTSACAENTGERRAWCCSLRNYLRVRGEYSGLIHD